MNNLICINRDLCMSQNYFIMLLVIFIGMTVYYVHITKRKAENEINKYKKILNDKTEKSEEILNNLPIRKLLEYRDRNVLFDPLIAPERRVDFTQYPLKLLNDINIPTRGYPDNYQLIGLLSRTDDEKILQLFGRPTYPGSNLFEYYATTETNGFSNKIPIETKSKREIEDGDLVKVPIFDQNKGDFKVKLYNYDTPRYNPYIY